MASKETKENIKASRYVMNVVGFSDQQFQHIN